MSLWTLLLRLKWVTSGGGSNFSHFSSGDASTLDHLLQLSTVSSEVAGQFIALLPLSYAAWTRDLNILALWPGWIAAFLLFRLFDIAKPGPVGWADRRGDALGVMLDDVIAGLFAAIGVMILAGIWHGVLGR